MLVDSGLEYSSDDMFQMGVASTVKLGRKLCFLTGGCSGQKELATKKVLDFVVTLTITKAEKVGHLMPSHSP